MAIVHSKVDVHRDGVDHVSHVLSRLGLLASLAPRSAAPAHVQVLSPDGQWAATLVVCARTDRSHKGWVMNETHESLSKPRWFYALVDFEAGNPVIYVVPSAVVSDWLKKDHARWLQEDPAHQDNPVRKLANGEWLDPYREAWTSIPRTSGRQL